MVCPQGRRLYANPAKKARRAPLPTDALAIETCCTKRRGGAAAAAAAAQPGDADEDAADMEGIGSAEASEAASEEGDEDATSSGVGDDEDEDGDL